MTKENYLKSPEWTAKRKARMAIDGKRCNHCGARHNLQVHHWNYANFGNENVETDLITLCDDCHLDYTMFGLFGSYHVNESDLFLPSDFRRDISKNIELPAEDFILFNEVQYYDPGKELIFFNDRIRLCRVHICSDYYNNKQHYDYSLNYKAECGVKLAPYEEYQWSYDKTWDILIRCRAWNLDGLCKQVCKGTFVTLNNGLRYLFATNVSAWEGYVTVTKDIATRTATILDEYEAYYRSINNSVLL